MKKKHEKTAFLAKSKLNSIEVSISKSSINLNNVLKKFQWRQQPFKSLNSSSKILVYLSNNVIVFFKV